MQNSWKKFIIDTTEEAEEAVCAVLMELGITSMETIDARPITEEEKKAMFIDYLPDPKEDDGSAQICFYLDEDCDPAEMIAAVEAQLSAMRAYVNVGPGTVRVEETKAEDWINNWKAFFKPFRVDDQIVIKPTWEPYEDAREGDLVIEMDPGTAFGTGAHETTKLCIGAIKDYLKAGDRVLDAGTGSGILAIIAKKLGAGEICAVDIDPNAVTAAEENVKINQVDGDDLRLMAGDILSDEEFLEDLGEPYDLVVANILADVIIPLSAQIGKVMKPDAVFISSGIIDQREQDVAEALKANGFEILECRKMGDWRAFAARKARRNS